MVNLNKIKYTNRTYICLFAIVFLAKLICTVFYAKFDFFADYTIDGFLGDTSSYLSFSKNFVDNGVYKVNDFHNEADYSLRMPGMAFILVPLLFLFSVSVTVKFFVLINIFFHSIAVVMLFDLLKDFFDSVVIKAVLLFFLVFGTYLNSLLPYVLNESIGGSLFVFIIYYFIKTKDFKLNLPLILVSLAFCWLVFLRPFFILFLPFFALKFLVDDFSDFKIQKIVRITKPFFVFCLIFFLFIGAWTTRNYSVTGKIQMLEMSIDANKTTDLRECTVPLVNFVKNIKGNQAIQRSDYLTAQDAWFFPDSLLKRRDGKRPGIAIFPKDLLSINGVKDSMEAARNYLAIFYRSSLNSTERSVFAEKFITSINFLSSVYMKNKGLAHKISMRKKSFIKFFLQPLQRNNISFKESFLMTFYNLINVVLNVFFITTLLLVSLIVFLKKELLRKYYFFAIPSFLLLGLFIISAMATEERELYCYYPAFLICGLAVYKEGFFKNRLMNKITIASSIVFTLLVIVYLLKLLIIY